MKKMLQVKQERSFGMFVMTSEEKDLQEVIRNFMEKEVKPVIQEYDERGEFPDEIYRKSFEIGTNSFEMPEEYGGLGLDYRSSSVIYEEMGRYDAGMALTMCTTNLALKPVLLGGNEMQKKLFCDLVFEGGYASFALTEPQAGSDAAAVKTKAVLDGDEYVINGSKCFITNGEYANVYIVFATTDKSKGVKGLSAFLVERSRPGISIGKEENKMGIRTSNTVQLFFDDVRIPKDHLIGKEGDGFKLAMKTLDISRPLIGAIAAGMMERCIEESVNYAKERNTFGKPIAGLQAIQFMIADMEIYLETSRQMYLHTIDLMSEKLPFSKEAAISKCYCTDSLQKVVTDAVQIMGGYGYMKDYPIEKIYRDSKIFQIFEGTNQIQRVVIAGQVMK